MSDGQQVDGWHEGKGSRDPLYENELLESESSALEWHKGPAEGGEGTASKDTWWDGDLLFVIVELETGRDMAIVTVHADEDNLYFLDFNEEDFGWSGNHISWWVKITPKHLPDGK